jgi:rhodanese-related sulfurtransferase
MIAKKLTWRDYEIHVLTMGIDSWREAGLPVEKGKK